MGPANADGHFKGRGQRQKTKSGAARRGPPSEPHQPEHAAKAGNSRIGVRDRLEGDQGRQVPSPKAPQGLCPLAPHFASRRPHRTGAVLSTHQGSPWVRGAGRTEHRAPYGTGDVSPRQGSWLPRPLGRKVLYAYTQETRSVPLLRSGAHARRVGDRSADRREALRQELRQALLRLVWNLWPLKPPIVRSRGSNLGPLHFLSVFRILIANELWGDLVSPLPATDPWAGDEF